MTNPELYDEIRKIGEVINQEHESRHEIVCRSKLARDLATWAERAERFSSIIHRFPSLLKRIEKRGFISDVVNNALHLQPIVKTLATIWIRGDWKERVNAQLTNATLSAANFLVDSLIHRAENDHLNGTIVPNEH
ncbi:Hypothetical predicted protein, partial [Olea europaea subsp. europaea]